MRMKNKMIADRYMIVSSIGEGGMADVYLGIDTILNREVAIKILRGELSNDPITLLRFQREANAASKLNHPNVVGVYDVGESEGRHYIVMEYVRGRTLKQLISQRGALDKVEAVQIMKQLVSAVQHAHENNIIHRDIKPQNVLVKDDGTVKITDFGIALAHDAVQLTQSDAVLGSAHYLAPETTRGEPATVQIDIYALGIVFYELLCGDVPYHGDNPVQIAMKHLREEIPSIRDFNPTLPQSIENIITKATVKNRSQRYRTAQNMLDDLNRCLLPEYVDVAPLVFEEVNDQQGSTRIVNREKPKQVQPEETKEARFDRRSKLIIGCLLLAIVAVATVAVLFFTGVFDFAKKVTVPDVLGLDQDEAIELLEKKGLEIDKVKQELTDDKDKNTVLSLSLKPGTEVKAGSKITITVSAGEYFVIEDYVGKNISEIEDLFQDSHLKIKIEKKETATSSYEPGTILSQSGLKRGKKIDPSKPYTITLEISMYPQVTISGIKGMKIDDAIAKLKAMGLKVITSQKSTVDFTEEELANLQKGVVVDSDPKEGTLYTQDGNSVITLYYY